MCSMRFCDTDTLQYLEYLPRLEQTLLVRLTGDSDNVADHDRHWNLRRVDPRICPGTCH